jgi:hypothetical protein
MNLRVTGRELTVLSGTIVTYLHVPFHGVIKTRTAPDDRALARRVYERARDAKACLFSTPPDTRTEEERVAVMNMSTEIELSRAETQALITMLSETIDWLGTDDYHAGIHIGRYISAADLRSMLARLVNLQQ